MSDRVPDDVVRRLQVEDTPPACGPHCHQAALIESLGEWLQRRAETEDERHRELLGAVAEVRGGLRTLQDQVVRMAVAQVETATAEATQRVRALRLPDSDPPASLPPAAGRSRLPRWAYGLAAGIGTVVGTAVTTYLAQR